MSIASLNFEKLGEGRLRSGVVTRSYEGDDAPAIDKKDVDFQNSNKKNCEETE
jgi:hypothetical protein